MTIPVHVVFGTGPLARAVVRALQRRAVRIRLVSRAGRAVGLEPSVEVVAADASVPDQARRACEGASVVYQCAQPEYHRWPELFPALQRGVVAGALTHQAMLVVAENLYGYGLVEGPMTEALPLKATTRKGVVRAAMTRELLEAHRQDGLKVSLGRGSDFFGPHVSGSAVGERLFRAALAGKPLDLLGDADALHAYTFIDDFGEALVRLGEHPERSVGRAWHVPNDTAVTSRRFAQLIASAAGSTSTARVVPRWLLSGLGLFVPAMRESIEMLYEFEHPFLVDDSAFRAAFGQTPTPLAEAIAATVAWYRAVSPTV
jgi:nucleoside-diphosphate-sugar epimerase